MEGTDHTLVVRFDQHQLLLLDRLVEDPSFEGDSREEVALHAFRAYVEGRSSSDVAGR